MVLAHYHEVSYSSMHAHKNFVVIIFKQKMHIARSSNSSTFKLSMHDRNFAYIRQTEFCPLVALRSFYYSWNYSQYLLFFLLSLYNHKENHSN